MASSRFEPRGMVMFCAAAFAALAALPTAAAAEPLAIRSHTLRVEIDGRVATTVMEQVYVNYTDSEQQATFGFRLPPEAAVTDLALWVDGLRTPAELHPRLSAERIFREIVNRKRDPALLTDQGNGLWNLQVFPVPRRATQKVQVICTQLLRAKDGQVVYEAPRGLEGAALGSAQEVDFTAVVRAPGGVKDLKAGKHSLGVQRKDGAFTVGFRDDNVDLSQPISFSFTPGSSQGETLVYAPDKEDAWFTAVLPTPKFISDRTSQPRSFAIVLDASESMTDNRFPIAQDAADQCLDKLSEADQFAVVAVSSDVALWKDKLVPADKANIEAARKFIGEMKRGGGTDLAAALRAAASFSAGGERRLVVQRN
ncbi:MAG: VIT domain-containing protein [Phycisphaerae bacterium]